MRWTGLLAGTAMAFTVAGAAKLHAQAVEDSRVSGVTGTTQITDRIEDLEEDTLDEFERSQDEARFGTAGVPEGFAGSLFASGSTSSGNTDTLDFGLGARFTLGQGRLSHTFGLAAEYGEANDERNENRVFGIYDLNYDLTERFYAFGLARARYDEFDSIEQDYFVGIGPGYRVFNEPNLAWRLQAGPGWRYTEDQNNNTESELAGIVSSRFYYQFSSEMFLTNDTDVLFSDVDTAVTNDLGFNMALQGPLSLRVGLLTDWSSDPLPGDDEFDNTLSAAVVYSFGQ
jgi:putative salt-induced outer membrane protein